MTNIVRSDTPARETLQPGQTMTVTANAGSNGRVGYIAPGGSVPASFQAIAAGLALTIGPFATVTRHMVEAFGGSLSYAIAAAVAHVQVSGDPAGAIEMFGDGAPVDYTDGDPVATGQGAAATGSRYTNVSTGHVYTNAGTASAPSWQAAVTLKGAIGDLCFFVGEGAPVDYTDGDPIATGEGVAGAGSQYTDITAGALYLNTGSKAEPVWEQLAFVE